ncbi:LysR family transcriptional regulator [Dankookia rubra]|uniref:LysR family transcriptional regulator n=1 Tax=Dankookia rubra TaxID=1442381 RepID=A0A4R5Q9W1_9PROT|nr:LysR family transcriptional regulator [Dankookia rubra]TDH59121.1 LysR family transcriptional regulator [Dankookia rubra]
MRSLNLDQLRTFVEVVALGNFSAAGRRLSLTQPAVSLHVRELEQRLGVRLVERSGRQARATAPGRELVMQAQQIFAACDAAEAAMRRFREGWLGRVHLGTTLSALMYDLPPILRALRRDYPGIELLVTNMPTRDSVDGVLRNALDLALVTLPVKAPRLRITPLRPGVLVAIFPANARDVPDIVTPAYFARQTVVLEHARGAVHALVMQWLAGCKLQGAPMWMGTIEAVKKAVASGLGVSIISDVTASEPTSEIVVRPLQPAVPCTLALVEQQNPPEEPALGIVRNALLEIGAANR